jgi:hypothetical protein
MNRISSLRLAASLLAFGLCIAPAHAQLARSFVSAAIGNDANAPNCNRTTPCRTFQVAANNTLANGEVTVLDPGSYGAVTITQNISIINDGVGEAGTLVSGGNTGVTVNAPGAAVTLRGLTIKGIGFGGGNGIIVRAAAAVHVENCTIRNLDGNGGGNGIVVNPNNTAVDLEVTNTVISDNVLSGILIVPAGAPQITAVLDHVGLYDNAFGVDANGSNGSGGFIRVVVNESVASKNSTAFLAQSATNLTTPTLVFVNRSVASFNGTGILATGPQANGVANGSTFVDNTANAWLGTSTGFIFTYGNNALFGNASNGLVQPANLQ